MQEENRGGSVQENAAAIGQLACVPMAESFASTTFSFLDMRGAGAAIDASHDFEGFNFDTLAAIGQLNDVTDNSDPFLYGVEEV